MRKLWILAFALLWLTGCSLHDEYTGEPFIRLEYTVNGEHFIWEDWGHVQSYFLSSDFVSDSYGALYLNDVNKENCFTVFQMANTYLSFELNSPEQCFYEGLKYELDSRSQFSIHLPENVPMTEGWFFFTRHTAEPYCKFDMRFEFRGTQNGQPYRVSEGVIQVGRRFQRTDISNLIKKERAK